ncbi:serine hydrolase [Brevibacillus reuszeri]|uniref:serine hydrolase n=1 Tax=Brevibacillus reuszeri TaxID=54915 RepID=UPI001B0983BA|nr:serine hydrolase [Brevibacillus reuszeri]GIO09504.1 serine hydrolase [Brevibacillus reuszeri]
MENKEWQKQFAEAAQPHIDKCGVPGVYVGLNKDGQSIYRQGFGYRDKERQWEITPDTVMGVASITKSFTCAAIMQLQEAGRLRVHDPVLTYLPEFRTPDQSCTEKMTIHHFMTHTSGLPLLPTDYLAIKGLPDGNIEDEDHPIHKQIKKEDQKWVRTYEDFMEVISKTDFQLVGQPGARFSYSNDAYSLLGAIIERVSGKTYETYIKEHILQPAGMQNSLFDLQDLQHYKEVTTIYRLKNEAESKEVYPDPQWEEGPVVLASGHLNSTVHDMLRYAELYRTGGVVGKERILSKESVEQMTHPHVQMGYGQYYGYGLFVTPNYYGATKLEHSGGLKGVASQMVIIPERGITGIAMANLAETPIIELLNYAVHLLENRPATSPSVPFPAECRNSEAQLRQYTGTYRAGAGHDRQVMMEQGALVLDLGSNKVSLRPIGDDYFVMKLDEEEQAIRFQRDGSGNVSGISVGVLYLVKLADENVNDGKEV